MTTIVRDETEITVPVGIDNLLEFRRWFQSPDFPESGRICFLQGSVWVDLSREQIFTHNQVKGEIHLTLSGLIESRRLGRFFPDGVMITNDDADLAAQPDGVFVSYESLRKGRVRLGEAAQEGYVELQGSPDLVIEVVSASSVRKDTVTLREAYFQAGIPEYWIVDARGERLSLDILRHGARSYSSSRKQAGWSRSTLLNAHFRLTRSVDELGHPEFQLAMRELPITGSR